MKFLSKEGIWLKPRYGNENKQVVVHSLVDTGSVYCLCPASLLRFAYKVARIPDQMTLVGAAGKQLKGICLADIPICLDGQNLGIMTFFVFDKSVPLKYTVLGMSWLEKHKCLIDIAEKTISITDSQEIKQMHHYLTRRVSPYLHNLTRKVNPILQHIVSQFPTNPIDSLKKPYSHDYVNIINHSQTYDFASQMMSYLQPATNPSMTNFQMPPAPLTPVQMTPVKMTHVQMTPDHHPDVLSKSPDPIMPGDIALRISEELIDVNESDLDDIVHYNLNANDIILDETLPEKAQLQTRQLVTKHLNIFAKTSDSVGKVPYDKFHVSLQLEPNKVAWTAKYRRNLKESKILSKLEARMERVGLFAKNEHCPMHMSVNMVVLKPGQPRLNIQSARLVTDFRKLNALLICPKFGVLPNLEEL